jgi:hypothetical protein
MFDVIGVAMLGGMAAMIVVELIQHIRDRSAGLHDRYHE